MAKLMRVLSREWANANRLAVESGFLPCSESYTRFVIVSSIRSGSTMFGSYLASHPAIKCFFELFHRDQSSIPFGIRGYERREHDLQALRMRNTDPAAFMETFIYNRHARAVGAVGFKLLYTQARSGPCWWNDPRYEHWWRLVDPPPTIPNDKSDLWEYLRSQNDLVVLHLVRRDYLARLVSFHKAINSGKWGDGATGGAGKDQQMSMRVDPDELIKDLEAAERLEQETDGFFRNCCLKKVIYEDLLKEPDMLLESIQMLLKVPPQSLAARTIKQNRQHPSECIANYRELESALSGTKWSYIFDMARG